MRTTEDLHRAARRSLASIALAAAAITVNHLYSLGPAALVLGGVLIVLPTLVLLWFRRSRSLVALAGYAAMNLWIVVGFGLYKGLWLGALRLFVGTALASVSTWYPTPTIGAYGFEASAILMFVTSIFVASNALQFMEAATGRTWPRGRGVGAIAFAAMLVAYVVADR